jgi:hypothetical protein
MVLVDDSPEKNLMNSRCNMAFPESWNYLQEGTGNDNFLLLTLGLFLRRAHEAGPDAIKDTVRKNRPGRDHLDKKSNLEGVPEQRLQHGEHEGSVVV